MNNLDPINFQPLMVGNNKELETSGTLSLNQIFTIRLNISYVASQIIPFDDIGDRLKNLRQMEASLVTQILNRQLVD